MSQQLITFGFNGNSSDVLRFGFGSSSSVTPAQIAAAVWNYTIEGSFSAKVLLRIIAAVAAGKTVVVSPTSGTAHVIFRTVTDSGDIVAADMTASERTSVVITP